MKKAAVIIDKWKLAIFKRHLEKAGYTYTELAGVTNDTLTLQVHYEWVVNLKPVIEAANRECSNAKLN